MLLFRLVEPFSSLQIVLADDVAGEIVHDGIGIYPYRYAEIVFTQLQLPGSGT